MLQEKPKVNQVVEVILDDEHPFAGSYPCIVKIITAKELVMTAPVKQWKAIPIKIGEIVTVNYWLGMKAYSFVSKVTDIKKGYRSTITVALPSKVRQLQRRKYLRVKVNIPITFALVNGENIYHTHTLDISGGGVLIKSPIQLQNGENLEMQLTVPKKGVIDILGKVMRCEKRTENKVQFFLVAVDFVVINERDRERIISYVFARERYIIKSRLI